MAVYVRKRVQRKRVAYKRKAPSRKMATVATVKRILNRAIETKYVLKDWPTVTLGAQRWYAIQPLTSITKGTNPFNRIGKEISNVNLRLAMEYVHLGNDYSGTTRLSTGSTLKCVFVRTMRDLSSLGTTSWAVATTSDNSGSQLPLFINPTAGASSMVGSAMNDVHIIKTFYLKSEQTTTSLINGTPQSTIVNLRIPKFVFDDDASSGMKSNYFILISSGGVTTTDNSSVGKVSATTHVTFKDA